MGLGNDILRGSRLTPMDDEALKITSSIESDKRIKDKVVYVNMAHIRALVSSGVMEKGVASKIMHTLRDALSGYDLDYRLEDVHMSLEFYVTSRIGQDAGFLGLGKSRNDQVAAALRLQAREELLNTSKLLISLIKGLAKAAQKESSTFFVAMTHLQPAQPSTAAHWLLSYAEAFLMDLERIKTAFKTTNLSPMGAAAASGSTVLVDRFEVADALGFDGLIENTIYAVSARDFFLDSIYALSSIAVNLSRLSADIVAYMALGLIDLDDKFLSTSSIMPQKRNPVVAEIIRAKAANVISALVGVLETLRGLNESYNLDLQEITPKAWQAFDEINSMLSTTASMVSGIRFNQEAALNLANRYLVVASDIAEHISLKHKVPFREAHHIVGEAIKEHEGGAEFKPALLKALAERGIKESQEELEQVLNALKAVESRATVGGPHPRESLRQVNRVLNECEKAEAWVSENLSKFKKSYDRLANTGW